GGPPPAAGAAARQVRLHRHRPVGLGRRARRLPPGRLALRRRGPPAGLPRQGDAQPLHRPLPQAPLGPAPRGAAGGREAGRGAGRRPPPQPGGAGRRAVGADAGPVPARAPRAAAAEAAGGVAGRDRRAHRPAPQQRPPHPLRAGPPPRRRAPGPRPRGRVLIRCGARFQRASFSRHVGNVPHASAEVRAVRPSDSVSPTLNSRGNDEPAPPASPSGPAEALASRLGEEMAQAWRRGERPSAEDFLARHPELCANPEAAVQLIYEEVLLRQEFGEEEAADAVLPRFPQGRGERAPRLACPRLLQQPRPAGPLYPEVGDTLGDLRILKGLGRGAQGRVVLAVQPFLADRPVVLKMSPREGQEHLALARLQHTHIAPLFWVQDFASRDLRVLCMPYLGGETPNRRLGGLVATPPERRSGRQLVEGIDRAQGPVLRELGLALPTAGPARRRLAGFPYVEAVCWVGACLAEALHYAHERGLVHLDVKPSNVLLASDGEPMLLDFHLAREPLRAAGPVP